MFLLLAAGPARDCHLVLLITVALAPAEEFSAPVPDTSLLPSNHKGSSKVLVCRHLFSLSLLPQRLRIIHFYFLPFQE